MEGALESVPIDGKRLGRLMLAEGPAFRSGLQAVRLDLRKEMKGYYRPPIGEVQLVKVPEMLFIMVDGRGAPEGKGFQEAIQALYGLAFTVKFDAKKRLGKDFPVMPLEGLWWMKGGGFDMARRDDWLWRLILMQPDFVSPKMFADCSDALRKRKNPSALPLARLEKFDEGLCVQTMHVGPYSAETKTMALLEAYAKNHGYKMAGKHHEIYLGDPRRAAPSRLKTVLRHPVSRIDQVVAKK